MKNFDLRNSTRLPISLPVKFWLLDIRTSKPSSTTIYGELRNVAPEGLCLETNTMMVDRRNIFLLCLRGDKRLRLEIDLPDIPFTLRLRGNVIWFNVQPPSSTYRYFAGINISESTEDTRNAWKKYVKKHKDKWYKILTLKR